MKTWHKLLAILLVAAMCVMLLAACASGSGTTEPAVGNEDENDVTETPATDLDLEEIETLNFWMLDLNNASGNKDAVVAAINEIIEPAIGANLNITYMDMFTYGTQLPMAIAGGENIDIACYSYVTPWAAFISQGQSLPLDDLLEAYGQDILAECGAYMDAMKVNGQTWGIPVTRCNVNNAYLSWNKDVAAELGLDMDNVNTWADLEAVFDAIKAADMGMYGIGGSRGLIGEMTGFISDTDVAIDMYDTLGDTMYLVYGAENYEVKSAQEHDAALVKYKMFADWMKKGYVYPDTLTNLEMNSSQLMGQDLIFCQLGATDAIGAEISYAQQIGKDVGLKTIGQEKLATANFTIWPTMIPVTANYPEKAVAFLNMLYTNHDLMNLLVYGIEGENYVIEDGMADFPAGTDATSCGYNMANWVIGNAFMLTPWAGNGADYQEKCKAVMDNAVVSDYMGFALDSSELSDTIAALSAVNDQYRWSMQSGLYTDSLYNEYVNALYTAGLQTYIDTYQAQVDAWVASK